MKRKKSKALLLFSGGLDSILAAKILLAQGVQVTLICFESYFFDCTEAKTAARKIGFKLRVEDFSQEHLKIIKSPKYGYGTAANPCLDCHLLMVKTAKQIAKRENYDFLATGDVLGERPMSQNLQALNIIDKKAGLENKIVRPLSALKMEQTWAEKRGLVDRQKLCGIVGRGRRVQMTLARKFKLKQIPQPSGGCILTEKDYGTKLFKLLELTPNPDKKDISLLRSGRIFFDNNSLITVARNETECKALKGFLKKNDFFGIPKNFSGPTVLLRNFSSYSDQIPFEKKVQEYILKYSKNVPRNPVIELKKVPK